ncbi:hypothetical protein DPMN_114718 [Dreissena polymorpha]|uniref:Uncharacterized protein n=1 Tax=Dreissena polymorpha TaxID=45954 RepID=A0A9D4QS09_DREPO|nr:hypothetical protein DPMN_114718 [Dreissena polymorpha]
MMSRPLLERGVPVPKLASAESRVVQSSRSATCMCSGALMNLCPGDSNCRVPRTWSVCASQEPLPSTVHAYKMDAWEESASRHVLTRATLSARTELASVRRDILNTHGMCTRNGAYGGICVSGRCPDTRGASCVNGWCVCSSSQVPYRGTCPRIRVPNRHHQP